MRIVVSISQEKIGVSMMRIIGMIKENDSARYMAHCGESLYEVSFSDALVQLSFHHIFALDVHQ